jgi:hypothetical protein
MEPYVEPWRPGIGDPTVMGWLTVIAYFGAAVACGIAHRRRRGAGHGWVWPGLCVLLVLLGFNKQLDLQSWFTEVGKRTALEQGWYEDRRSVQVAFIAALATTGLVVGSVALHRLRGALGRFRLALLGIVFLIAFIVIRAASFHHVDLFLKLEFAGVRPNWVLELGGIALIAVGALRDAGLLERFSRRKARPIRKPRRRKRAEDMGWLDILIEVWQRGAKQRPTTGGRPKAPRVPQAREAASGPPRGRSSTAPRGQCDEKFRVVMTGPPRRNRP